MPHHAITTWVVCEVSWVGGRAIGAYRTWRTTRTEATGDIGETVEAGEGRTRFLSLWGTMTSLGFVIALLFSLIAIWGVPPCGYP